MIILAVDTTSQVASVAIRKDGRTVAEIVLESTDGFGHVIFTAIERCRNEAGLSLNRIDCVAAASGPGTFTGLRIGLSVVKGLAEALGKPVAGISNLRALGSFGKNPRSQRPVVLDARRGEVYAAVYDADLKLVLPEVVLPFSAWLGGLDPSASYEFISPTKLAFEDSLYAAMPFVESPRALAPAVALCAERDGHEGKWLEPAALDANYVRRPDASLG